MVDKPIHDLTMSELSDKIQKKETEYHEAIKSKKEFWEVKKIVEQRKDLEWQLFKRKLGSK